MSEKMKGEERRTGGRGGKVLYLTLQSHKLTFRIQLEFVADFHDSLCSDRTIYSTYSPLLSAFSLFSSLLFSSRLSSLSYSSLLRSVTHLVVASQNLHAQTLQTSNVTSEDVVVGVVVVRM